MFHTDELRPWDDYTRCTYISNVDGRWYAYAVSKDKHEVYSIGSDCPREGGLWMARWTDSGIRYVASPSSTRRAAYQKARRWGNYCGEV